MANDQMVAPVIIKRKKIIAADGHHGGACKVAYADFVTAIMAFFMLMWLLNATTEQQKKGIADYFSPTLAINRSSGGEDSSFVGDTVFTEEILTRQGVGASTIYPTESAETDNIMKHIVTRVTDEGLVVEFYDSNENTLFDNDNKPTPLLNALMTATFRAADFVTNPVALESHVASPPIVLANKPQWRTTSERAVMARESLIDIGFDPTRVARVTGHADQEHAVRNPMAARNNRLELIFLRQ